MSSIEKKLAKFMRSPPATDIKWDEFASLAERIGFVWTSPGGSHGSMYNPRTKEYINTVIRSHNPTELRSRDIKRYQNYFLDHGYVAKDDCGRFYFTGKGIES